MMPLQPAAVDVPMAPMLPLQMHHFPSAPVFGPVPIVPPAMPNAFASPIPLSDRLAASSASNARTTTPQTNGIQAQPTPPIPPPSQAGAPPMENPHGPLWSAHWAAHVAGVQQQDQRWRHMMEQTPAATGGFNHPSANTTGADAAITEANAAIRQATEAITQANAVGTQATTGATSPVAVNGDQQEPTPQDPPASANSHHPLPSWGSSAAPTLDQNSSGTAPANGSHTDESSEESSSRTSEPKDRHATVEDLVEDPD